MDVILIEGLQVNTVVGCFAWEREILQPLMLDLKVYSSLEKAAQSDDLEDTLNYAQICELTSQTIQQAKPKLIEHAAKLVLETLFTTFTSIEKIKITIRKPAIIPQAQSVGVCFERQRDDFCTRTSE